MNKEIMSQEIESMIRTLDFIQEEQAFIKRKLSSLLENMVMSDVLVWAEELHQQILNRETVVQLLKNDLIVFRNNVKLKRSVNNIMSLDAIALFKKYKQQVGYIESEFYVWKNKTNEQFESSLN
jgi:16S rRNA C1402 (ribose-2'-O) methylase RsmI